MSEVYPSHSIHNKNRFLASLICPEGQRTEENKANTISVLKDP